MWDVPERYAAAGNPSGRTNTVSGKLAAGCSVRQEARCLDRRYREKEECHPRRNTL